VGKISEKGDTHFDFTVYFSRFAANDVAAKQRPASSSAWLLSLSQGEEKKKKSS
jgi:hypothetical protein